MEQENIITEEQPLAAPEEETVPAAPAEAEPPIPAPEENPEPSPEENPEPPIDEAKARRHRKRRNSLVFYSFYLLFILGFIFILCCAMKPLESWLTRYEYSQPEYARSEVFNMLFTDPDWDLLYDLGGIENTEFEGKQDYIAYMEEKVGDDELVCQETSAGLSGNKKYLITHDGEKIASFILTPTTDGEFTTWQLDSVDIYFTRSESVTVTVLPEQTVYINGVALDDSYTIKTISTVAEDYLPEGIHGYRLKQVSISGLLMPPTVTVLDEDGSFVSLMGTADTGVYSIQIPLPEQIGEEETQIALEAAKANALYAIRAISAAELRTHFDPNSQVYSDIFSTAVFVQSYKSYAFDESVSAVSDFYRYSNELFSARVTLKMDVTRKDGTVRSYETDTTYFFTKNAAGSYLVTDMTNVAVQRVVSQVRVTFMEGNTVISTQMVPSDAETIVLPKTPVPDGYVLQGWAQQETDEDGHTVLTIVLEPAGDGTAHITDGQVLDPMTLYPVLQALSEDVQ